MSKEDLPSIDDLVNNDLPSVEEFITEENAEELPSVEDYIEIEESTQTIEDADGNTFAEVQDIIPPWPELVRMINDVRADIPDIPEVKYYDKELEELAEQISNLPEVRYYDREVEAICDQVDLVREQIKGLPEVKYYDEQVDAIEDRIDTLQTEVTNLPEVKYYDAEIAAICEAIDAVKASIPKFPKWVNEINEVPDFSWIGKTFSVIDDDFVKVNDTIEGLRGKVQFDLEQLSEDVETKHFNSTIKIENDISTLGEKVDNRIDEEKDKIWKELRSSSLKMWEYHKEFKDDDRKLKKQILGEYNTLKQNINKELKEINYTSTKTDELLLKYFTELREEISGLPEVKYYDKDIDYVKSDIKGLYKLVEDIKSSQKQLQEEQKLLAETNVPLGSDPPDTDNPDPLTPLNQDFVTLDQLQKHYKIFVERVQYQLASIGGGGAGFIKDLDDVDISGLEDNFILQYDSSVSKWKTVANNAGAGGTWATSTAGIHTTKNVGIATTARSDFALYVGGHQYVDGNITVGGTVTYEDVKNVDSLGIVTARTGVKVSAGGIDVVGVSTISVSGVGTVRIGVGNTALLVQGDARVTGILTVGEGSITLDPNTKQVTGIDEIVVGSGVSLSLAPLFNSAGKFSVDYSKLTLKGYNPTLEGTYERQSTSFVLGTAPTTSGSARFQETSGFYYFLHESDNSKIIIFNIITGNWDAVHSSGSNFSSPSSGTLVNPVSVYSFVTPVRASFDDSGRVYPGSGFGVEYKTVVTGQTSSLGIATGTSLDISGIVTASSFRGDGSQLTNIISGVGIQSGSVRTGTGFTDINFTGAGVTVVGSGTTITVDIPTSTITRQTETSSGVTTDFTITGGYTVGLIDVFLNGVKQRSGVDFTASDGSTVTMTPFISDGDVVEFQKYDKLNIAGITSVTNATNAYNIVGGVSFATSAGIATALNSDSSINTSGIITAASFVGDGSSLTGVASTDNIITGTAATFTGNVNISGVTTVGLLTAYTTIKVGTAITMDSASGIVTATSFSGSGSSLTGLTGASAATYGDGSNVAAITVDSNGRITGISEVSISGGGGGSSGVEVKNNGTSVGTGITAINFSTNVTATASGGIATVTASGGGSDGPNSVIMGMIF